MSRVADLKYLRIGDHSYECGKIISVCRHQSWFGKPRLTIVYDAPSEYSGVALIFARLGSNAPSEYVFDYTDDTTTRDQMFKFIRKIIEYHEQLQSNVMNSSRD